jgi:hypothetical protein
MSSTKLSIVAIPKDMHVTDDLEPFVLSTESEGPSIFQERRDRYAAFLKDIF